MNPDIDKFPVPNTGATGIDPHAAVLGMPGQPIVQASPTGIGPNPLIPQSPALVPAAPTPSSPPTPAPLSPATPSAMAHMPRADDEEFEKKWVAIAKSIVERTRSDPYLQSQELNKASKEYREQIGQSTS